jgi:hypothetical protein
MSDSTSVPQEDQIPETIVPCWKCRYCLALPDRAQAS